MHILQRAACAGFWYVQMEQPHVELRACEAFCGARATRLVLMLTVPQMLQRCAELGLRKVHALQAHCLLALDGAAAPCPEPWFSPEAPV
jgi:hypothetical protein